MKKLLTALSLSALVSAPAMAFDYGKLAESVDTEKAVQSVDQKKLGSSDS